MKTFRFFLFIILMALVIIFANIYEDPTPACFAGIAAGITFLYILRDFFNYTHKNE